MDKFIMGSLREKLDLTFSLLDMDSKGQITYDCYTSFVTQYLTMCEEMLETQIRAPTFKVKTASDFEAIAFSRQEHPKVNT